MDEDPEERREREYDAITFVLAAVLSVIILGAIGYGILNSSRGTSTIPSLNAGSQIPRPPEPPGSTTGSR